MDYLLEEKIFSEKGEQKFVIKESRTALEALVLEELKTSLSSDDTGTFFQENAEIMSSSVTDALIRYQEGISCSLRSKEEEGSPDAHVQWISRDGLHAICVTENLKKILNRLLSGAAVQIICYKKSTLELVLSTFIQAAISLYMEYKRELMEPQGYVLALCYQLAVDRHMKIFTIDTLFSYNLEYKQKNNYMPLSKKEIEACITSLQRYGFFVPCGNGYRTIY